MQYPTRDQNSHKGQNGKILIIGGNELYHGAPILAAKGAEATGCDLIFLAMPKKNAPIARQAGLNFIVHEFQDPYLTYADVPFLLEFAHRMCDSFVIGNGIGDNPKTKEAIKGFLDQIRLPGVVDAEGLIPEVVRSSKKENFVLTPHEIEFERIFGLPASKENVRQMAKQHGLTILKKGKIDYIAHRDKYAENETGCAEMTVGGTGDALSGIVGGLIARGQDNFSACKISAYFWGLTGQNLAKERTALTAEKMLKKFPIITKKS